VDPLWFLQPLFDAYAAPVRARCMDDPRLSPTLAPLATLPRNMLFIMPTLDILLDEQVAMVERLRDEAAAEPAGERRRIEAVRFEGQLHGWIERKCFLAGSG
jgi:acetyl esterase/lipase